MTNNKTIAKLLLNLKHGYRVIIKSKDNNYCIFYPDKDRDGDYRASTWEKTIKEAKSNIIDYGYSREKLLANAKHYKWQIIDCYIPEYDRIPNGTRVRIKENAKKECEKYDISCDDEMIGKIFRIQNRTVGNIYNINDWAFPQSAFELVVEEEEEAEEEAEEEEEAVVVAKAVTALIAEAKAEIININGKKYKLID